MFDLPTNRWGDTSPTLKIANHFGIDWDWTLAITDHRLHGRPPNTHRSREEWNEFKTSEDFEAIIQACEEVAIRTRAMWAQGASK